MPAPATRREVVSERIHGHQVADPYRWLEDGTSPEVGAWIDAQNAWVAKNLGAVPGRSDLARELSRRLSIGSVSLPALRRHQGRLRLFFLRREPGQEQPVLYVRDGISGTDRALFDPKDDPPSAALDWYVPSSDGTLVAYGVSRGGTEDSTLFLLRVEDGTILQDRIPGTRFASVAWTPDGRSFFYSRHPKLGSVPAGEERLHRRIHRHILGTDPESDPVIFGEGLRLTDFPGCQLSPNGRWLLVPVQETFSQGSLYLADLDRKGPLELQRITPDGPYLYHATALDDAIVVLTNWGAPRFRLLSTDPEDPDRSRWRVLIEEHPTDPLEDFQIAGEQILALYQEASLARLERFDREGRSLGPIPLPGPGTSDGVAARPDLPDAFYHFETFETPPQIRHLDLEDGTDRPFQVSPGATATKLRIERHEARSRDGTRVPYFVVSLDSEGAPGPRAAVIHGYGGFGISFKPRFLRAPLVLLERGGLYVHAILRGGGELGEAWHDAACGARKPRTFEDLESVAEDLVARGLTVSERLAVLGRSNGGLTAGAIIIRRPELFRAAVLGVPLTDMVRYPRFSVGRAWESEYGSPDDPDAFRALLAYSPYHNVRDQTAYPAVLVTTAENDSRVDPLHGRKLVAALQRASTSGHPVLLRTERDAGHGAGTPVRKQVEETSDVYAFLVSELKLVQAP